MSKKKDAENELVDNLGIGICDIDSSAFADFSNEDFGSIDLDQSGLAGLQSDNLGSSHFSESPHGSGIELSDAESAIIRLVEGKTRNAGGRAAASKTEKIYITHEDFDEGPERDAFLLIYGYAEHLFSTKAGESFDRDDRKKIKALRFFFCKSLSEFHFEEAASCIDGSIRVDVLRLRFMYEFWVRGWKLPALPDDADPLPSRIVLMGARYETMLGVSIAREAWYEPGIEAADLIARVLDGRDDAILEKIKKAFSDMVLDYVISLNGTQVYLTGKNPILEFQDKINDPTVRVRSQLASINWSRRF